MVYLSAIVPAYNEGEKIYQNLQDIDWTLSDILGKDKTYEIILVDDGSKDNTYAEAQRAEKDIKSVKTVTKLNGGKGSALKYGFQYVKGEYVAFIDADLDLHPKQLQVFFEEMKLKNAGAVVGSKRHPNSKIIYPTNRKILSAFYYGFVKTLFGLNVTDTQVGLKLFKYPALRDTMPRILCKKYAFDLELLVNIKHQNYKIVDAPIELNWQRVSGRIKGKDVWYIFLDTAAIFYRLNIIRYYDKGKNENPSFQLAGHQES